eukprot:209183_1
MGTCNSTTLSIIMGEWCLPINIHDSNIPLINTEATAAHDIVEHSVDIANDYTNERINLASKFIGLEKGDDIDVNPIINKHKGWRCGEVEEIIKDENRILKIKVSYEQDDDYIDVWIT